MIGLRSLEARRAAGLQVRISILVEFDLDGLGGHPALEPAKRRGQGFEAPLEPPNPLFMLPPLVVFEGIPLAQQAATSSRLASSLAALMLASRAWSSASFSSLAESWS